MRRVIVAGVIYLAAASLAPAGMTKGRVVNLTQDGIGNVTVEVLHPVTLAPLLVGGRSLTTKSATADDPVENVKKGDYEIPIPDAVTQGLNYRVALRFTKLGRKEVLLKDIDAKEDNTISVIEPEEDRPPYTQRFREERARVILSDAINTGAPLFNQGDWADCYGIYHGALLSIRPLLNTRPNLDLAITNAFLQANVQPSYYDRAWTLRRVIDLALEQLGSTP
jgi:hypothetical protein